MAMDYAEKDLQYKRQINDNLRLYAGSLGIMLYIKKNAIHFLQYTYIDVIRLKQNNIKDANALRYEIIDHVSKDYNSSCNAYMELSALLHTDQDIQGYISAVEGRINMNPELSATIYHSWYICALYFYESGEYVESKHYIRKFYKDYYFQGDITDTRQEIRAKLLEVKILLKTDSDAKSVQVVLDEVIEILKSIYSKDSFWLIEPYAIYDNIEKKYSSELIKLKEKYVIKREKVYG